MTLAALTGAVQIIRSDDGVPVAILVRADRPVEDTEVEWNDAVAEAIEYLLGPADNPALSFGQWELFLLGPDPELFVPGTILEDIKTGDHFVRRWTSQPDDDEWVCLETVDTYADVYMLPWSDFKVVSVG